MSSKTQKSIDIASLSTLAQLNINPQELEALQEQFPQILKLADSLCDLDVEIVDSINNSLSLDDTRSDDVKPYDQTNNLVITVSRMVNK